MPPVVLVGPSWPFRGGIARTTTSLAEALAARGALARFLVPFRQYGRLVYPGAGDVDAGACGRIEVADACFGVLEPWTWPRAVARVRSSPAGTLVLPYWTAAWAPFDLALLAAASRPAVAVVHNPADHDAGFLARRAAVAVLSRCRAFLCHAEAVSETLRQRWPDRPIRVHPLPPSRWPLPPREAARARLGVASEVTAFLCFGLIRPYKGVDVLLDAFARLPAGAPAVLLLAGEAWGDLAQEVPRRLASDGLRGRVVARIGWVPEAEASDWFAAADAVVLPYRTATGSAVAAQALGAGRPLIGTSVGGLAEVIADGANGIVVPPGDPEALAAALERALEPGVLESLRHGVVAGGGRWSWGSYAQALLDLAGDTGPEPARRAEMV